MQGHVGVYIGGGEAIESRGTAYGVVKTKVAGRGWTNWFHVPGVEYSSTTQPAAPIKPAVTIPATIRKGSAGVTVRQLQTLLIQFGYKLPIYGIDSKFGEETKTAVINYQRDNRLEVDGIVGPQTWGRLLGVS